MDNIALIVDDDVKLRKLLQEYLEGYNFKVLTLPDGENVLETIKTKSPDIVILDIMLPKTDGLEILKQIRYDFSLPVIMLTAKGEDTDRIIGLELGADDYLPKPFNPRELLARMKAVLRRGNADGKQKGNKQKDILVKAGGIVLNRAKQTIVVDGREEELSTTEFKLLEVLMENPNTVLNRDQLMNAARGRDSMAFDRSIDVHISKLRVKLKSISDSHEHIKTVWGTGYKFIDVDFC